MALISRARSPFFEPRLRLLGGGRFASECDLRFAASAAQSAFPHRLRHQSHRLVLLRAEVSGMIDRRVERAGLSA